MVRLQQFYIKISQIATIQYLLIYIAIQFIGGRVQAFLGSDAFYGFTIVLCAVLIVLHPRTVSLKKDYVLFLTVMALSAGVTFFLTNGALGVGTILSLLSRFLIIYTVIKIDHEHFLERFLKTTYVMAIISLCLFFFVQIVGVPAATALFSNLYEIKNGDYWLGSSYGLLLICYNFMDPGRNAYMFGEPGEYQSLVMTSIYFLTFFSVKIQNKKKYFIVFILTLLTVQSTTGFLNFLVYILVVLFFNKTKISAGIRRVLTAGIFVGVVYLIFFYSTDSFLYTSFFGKIFNEAGSVDFTVSTGAARVGPIIRFIHTFRQMPESMIFGVGYEGLAATPLGEYSTCGIINFIAMLGMVTTVIVYGKMLSSMVRHTKLWLQAVFVLFYVINMGFSQPDFLTITVVLMCMYGEITESGRSRM